MQRKSIPDHVKRNTESHLKLACERLQELQVSSTLTKANIEEMQTEIVTAMKKIKALSEAVQKSESLQVSLCDKIAAINKKLPKFQSRDDATDGRLSALKADVASMNTKVEELAENLSSKDETLSELIDDVTELRVLLRAAFTLQSAQGTLNTNLQNMQEAMTKYQETNRDRKILSEIDYAKWELRSEFQAELHDIRRDAKENKRLLDRRETRFRKIIIIIFCIAIFVYCVWYGVLTDLFLLILSIF